MNSDYLPGDLKALWTKLGTNPPVFSPDQLRVEAEKLRTGLHKRSVIGGSAALFVIVGGAFCFLFFPNWLDRIGSILTALGAGYLLVQLRTRAERSLPDVGATNCVRFYTAELERQRDFHQGRWLWSRLLIFLPGPIIICVGFAQTYPRFAAAVWIELAAVLILASIAVPLNLRLARRYQRRIDALNASLRSRE